MRQLAAHAGSDGLWEQRIASCLCAWYEPCPHHELHYYLAKPDPILAKVPTLIGTALGAKYARTLNETSKGKP